MLEKTRLTFRRLDILSIKKSNRDLLIPETWMAIIPILILLEASSLWPR